MLAYPRASRGLQPRLKCLDVLMVLKRENTSIDGFRAALPILRCQSGFATPTETFGCFNGFET